MPVAVVSFALAVDALYVSFLRGMVILAVAAVPMAIVAGAIYAFATTEPDVHRYGIKLTSPETEFTSTPGNSVKRGNSDQPYCSRSNVDTATPLGKPSAVVNSSLRGAPLDKQLALVLEREADLNATLGHVRTRASRLKRFLGRVEEYDLELQVVARATSWLRAAYGGLGHDSRNDSTEVAPDISATPAERQQATARQATLLHAASLQALASGTASMASMASAGRAMHVAMELQAAADAVTAREAARQAAAAESAKAVLDEMDGRKDYSTSAGRDGGEVPSRRLLATPLAAHIDADTLHEFTDVHADSPPRSPPLTSIADAAPTACWTVSAATALAIAAAAPAKPTMLTAHELRVLARAQGARPASPRKGRALGPTCSTPLGTTCTKTPMPRSSPSDERAVRAQEVLEALPALPVLVRKATPGVKHKIKSTDIKFVHDPDLDSDVPLSIIAHATGARWRLPNGPAQQDPSEAEPIRARIDRKSVV